MSSHHIYTHIIQDDIVAPTEHDRNPGSHKLFGASAMSLLPRAWFQATCLAPHELPRMDAISGIHVLVGSHHLPRGLVEALSSLKVWLLKIMQLVVLLMTEIYKALPRSHAMSRQPPCSRKPSNSKEIILLPLASIARSLSLQAYHPGPRPYAKEWPAGLFSDALGCCCTYFLGSRKHLRSLTLLTLMVSSPATRPASTFDECHKSSCLLSAISKHAGTWTLQKRNKPCARNIGWNTA